MSFKQDYRPQDLTQGRGRLYTASRAAEQALEALRAHAATCRAINASRKIGTGRPTRADGDRLRKLHRLAWIYETAEAKFRFLKSKELGE